MVAPNRLMSHSKYAVCPCRLYGSNFRAVHHATTPSDPDHRAFIHCASPPPGAAGFMFDSCCKFPSTPAAPASEYPAARNASQMYFALPRRSCGTPGSGPNNDVSPGAYVGVGVGVGGGVGSTRVGSFPAFPDGTSVTGAGAPWSLVYVPTNVLASAGVAVAVGVSPGSSATPVRMVAPTARAAADIRVNTGDRRKPNCWGGMPSLSARSHVKSFASPVTPDAGGLVSSYARALNTLLRATCTRNHSPNGYDPIPAVAVPTRPRKRNQ